MAWKGEFGRAVDELEKAKRINPEFYLIRMFLGVTLYEIGDYERAAEEHQKAAESGSALCAMHLELALSQSGRKEEADRLFEELKRRSEKEYLPPALFFLMYLERGRLAEAVKWLKKAGEMHDGNLGWIRVVPPEGFKSPDEPRLITLVKKGFIKAMITRTISRYRITEEAA